ncbi:tubulin delta chain-like [Dysidea avara]|uniref:tubulin delta chain-like n=1 Tax=Dysidea avara TaxID=196820 RepID=UPI00332B60E2
MSIVTVQLGQCGNQIGNCLFSTLLADSTRDTTKNSSYYEQESIERFFHRDKAGRLVARAVLVDMEPKVVQQSLTEAARSKKWRYNENSVYYQNRGSGNNWANGYVSYGPKAAEKVADLVQKQLEYCDHVGGVMVMMSVAGGTGSGVGARVTEVLHDMYPNTTLLNQTVWPYSSGEVIVQGYNTLLTLSHLYKSSDAIMVLYNDQLHKTCSQLLKLKHISFGDMNNVASHGLASILQPAVPLDCFNNSLFSRGGGNERFLYSMCSLSELVTSLCPHQHYKLLSLKSIPQMPDTYHAYTSYLWAGLLRHLRQMLLTDASISEGMDWTVTPEVPLRQRHLPNIDISVSSLSKSLANLLILRGSDLQSADVSPFKDAKIYSSGASPHFNLQSWVHWHPFNKYEKSASVLTNSQGIVLPLNTLCQKSWDMFASRAYLHQYARYGISEEDMLECFVSIEQVLKNYASLK